MREKIPSTFISILFLLLIIGLFYNQVARYGYYSRLSKNNSIRIIPIDGPRGNVYDRSGILAVSNRLSFDVSIVYHELKDRQKLIKLLESVLNMKGRDIVKVLEKARNRPYAPVTILEDIDKNRALMFEEATYDTDGLSVETRAKRDYLYGKIGSHIFGYLSEITEPELDDMREYGYRPGDLVGRAGLERFYETYLRGFDGGTQIEVDSRGREVRVIGVKEPSSGRDLYLTIDMGLQSACDKLFADRKGAICVMAPSSGEVLALVSHPTFDPNAFVTPGDSAQRAAYIKDRVGRPMSNRAISGLYPPGSVFKAVVAAAALETHKISDKTIFVCNGSYKMGRASFGCWKSDGHDSQNVVAALMNSCNVFFYNAGRITGVDAVQKYAQLFGFGKMTGIDLPDEVSGVAPGKDWKLKTRRAAWFEGDTINYSIGQGYLLVTPMQVLEMISAIANNGYIVKPFIVRRVGEVAMQPGKPSRIGLRPETIKVIQNGLYEVINNEEGTGKRAKVEGVVVAGKTGTAQNPHGRTHAWFMGYAPFENPKIAVVVFIEHGGKGGIEPAEIAKTVFEEARKKGYF